MINTPSYGSSGGYGNKNRAEKKDPEKIPMDRIILPVASQLKIIEFSQAVLMKHRGMTDVRNKMDAIDVAYARYKCGAADNVDNNGYDDSRDCGNTGCNVFAADDITPPIVVSQVDSYVAYLAEVFLSGSPIFPVVSSPSKRIYAEQLEAVMDDHAIIGEYARQFLMFFRDGIKYNFSAIEADWTSIDDYQVLADISPTGQSLNRMPKKYTTGKRINPRNAIWDYSLNPGDVSRDGDYAGYVELYSKMKMKRFLASLEKEKKCYNHEKAMNSSGPSTFADGPNYYADPQVSEYISSRSFNNAAPDWDTWFDGKRAQHKANTAGMYEKVVLYARILPSDFGMPVPGPNTPQIWKFVICNNQWLIQAERIISAFDRLPILFGQPLEDGLSMQTQSVAESEIPYQRVANTLFNIRIAASRRAVSDRALYRPDMIKPSDINSPVPAPKIPVHISALSQLKLSDAYTQIPFDMRGTETTIQDVAAIIAFSKDLTGSNGPRQGSFQKGNKSVQEWNDTMGGSEGRMRLPAITLEHQVFIPFKNICALNILQYGTDGVYTLQSSGRDVAVKIEELRKVNLSFKIADGLTPKAKLASVEAIELGLNTLMNAPLLQQALGSMAVPMFLHMMTLMGVKGMDEYDPRHPANQEALNTQIPRNNLQNPGMPTEGDPNMQIPAAAAPGMPPGMAPPMGMPPQMPMTPPMTPPMQ